MAGVLDIAKRAGVKVEDATRVFRVFAEMIAEGHDKITIQGLGNIDYSYRGAKASRNPKTGEAIEVDAKVVPKFNFNRGLKELVDSNDEIKKAAKAYYDELADKREEKQKSVKKASKKK